MKRKSRKDLEIIVAALEAKVNSFNALFSLYVKYRDESDDFQAFLKKELSNG